MSGEALNRLVQYAETHGTEFVFESAGGLTSQERHLLRIELDRIEAGRKGRRYTVGHRRRRTPDETAQFVLVLAEEFTTEGLCEVAVRNRIADKLGLSDAYVARVLQRARRESETPEIAPLNRRVQADCFATKRKTGIGVPLADPRVEIA